MKVAVFIGLLLITFTLALNAQTTWQANLDSKIRFYQTTDFGIVLAGTEHSLYAIDGQTGERIWRSETGRINETAVTPVPDTDLILFSRDLGDKSRLEAVDVVTGARIWQSDKVKGDVMQLAADPQNDLIAVVLVRDTQGKSGEDFKRKPIVHMLRLSSGDELWKRELDSAIEMMPARYLDGGSEVAFTLDNYRAPLMIDDRLFLFYEGATSIDAQTGKEKERETFKINEDGLALTEADPVVDDQNIYISGRGRIRAVDRRTGNIVWKADDLGTAAEMVKVGDVLYVRTGGQFTRIKNGEIVSKGPYGVSAINAKSGDTIWRYKGADKGITNFIFGRQNILLFADGDDVIALNPTTGKKLWEFEHKIDKAQFLLLNESRDAVVGGRDEIAAFDFFNRSDFSMTTTAVANGVRGKARPAYVEKWRVRHKAPGRGAFRIIAGIALRATALYFRYGGVATSAFSLARGGLNLASAANLFRWSGLRSRFGSFDLTTLASNSAKSYVSGQIYSYGSLGRLPNVAGRLSGLQIITPSGIRGSVIRAGVDRITPSQADVRESIFDRLDPTRQMEKLSDYLLRKRRLAELRGNYMYFYTELAKPFDRKGLVGVNIHTGQDARFILNSDPDAQFITDESVNLLYSADGNKLQAFDILSK